MSNDVDIKVREDGSVVVIRNFENIATAADTAQTAIDRLKAALGSLKGTSLAAVVNEVKSLKTALSELNRGGAELNSLKTALSNFSNSITSIKNLADALIKLGGAGAGLGGLHNTLQAVSTSANNVDRLATALAALQPMVAHVHNLHAALSALVALNPQVGVLASELRNLAGNRVGLRELQSVIAALNRDIGMLVAEVANIARVLQALGAAANQAGNGMRNLRYSLVGMAALFAIHQLREWLDAWQSAAGLFKVATDSLEEMGMVQREVTQIARDTRQEFTPTVELYARLNRSAEDLGVSQNDVIGFTKGINTALAIQHTSANQARGALMQLGQAMGFGKVRAQEFNSMNENLPLVLKTVAKNLDGAGGSVVRLRQMMLDGKLMSKDFFEAFMKGAKDLDKDFAKTSVTISQAIAVMNTNFIEFMGHLDDALGIIDKVGRSFIGMSEALNVLIPVTAFAAILYAGTFVPALASAGGMLAFVTTQMKALWTVMLANPMAATIGVITALTIAVVLFKDQVNIGQASLVQFNGKAYEAQTTLGDLLAVAKDFGGEVLGTVGMVLGDEISKLGLDEKLASFFNLGSFEGFVRGVMRLFDLAGASVRSFFGALEIFGGDVLSNIGSGFDDLGNKIIRTFNLVNRKLMEGRNYFRKQHNQEPLVAKQFEEVPVAKHISGRETLDKINANSASLLAGVDDPNTLNFRNLADAGFRRMRERAEERRLAQLKAEEDMKKKTNGASPPNDDAKKALEKLRKEWEKIQNAVDPIGAALREQNEALEFIRKNASKFNIDVEKYSNLIKEHYKDSIDPLGAATRELDKQYNLGRMMLEDRKIKLELQRQIEQLKKSGKYLTPDETKDLRDKIARNQDDERLQGIRDEVSQQRIKFRGPLDEENAYKDILTRPDFKDPKKAILGREMEKNPDLFAGTQEQIDAQVRQWDEMYRRIDFLREKDIISEKTAAQMKARVDKEARDKKLEQTNALLNGLAALQDSGSKKAMRIGKAAAIAQATIAMYTSIADAYKNPPGWPLNAGAVIGVTVAQAANLAKIRSVGFMTGGSFDVTGSGGADSQTVAFRASPGERVTVQTPTQYRKGDPNQQNNGNNAEQPIAIKMVNLFDHRVIGDYLATPEGEKLIMNHIQKNAPRVRQLIR